MFSDKDFAVIFIFVSSSVMCLYSLAAIKSFLFIIFLEFEYVVFEKVFVIISLTMSSASFVSSYSSCSIIDFPHSWVLHSVCLLQSFIFLCAFTFEYFVWPYFDWLFSQL